MELRSKERVVPVEIYTDGSLKKLGTTTFGGWAFVVIKFNKEIYISTGHEIGTTNQRMELTAILEALKYAKENRKKSEKIIIYSDSAYAINCYNQKWYLKWLSNGWINSKGEDVANADLWGQIVPFFENFWFDFRKVKGHNNVLWNEKCDQLAQQESQILKNTWQGLKI